MARAGGGGRRRERPGREGSRRSPRPAQPRRPERLQRGAPRRGERPTADRQPGERRPGREVHIGDLLYGRNAVREALRAGRRRFRYLAVAAGAQKAGTLGEILELAAERGVPLREVERFDLDELAPGNQGVALQASEYPYVELDALIERIEPGSLFLLLDLIEDPQNLGTLLRTADVVGVQGVVIPEHRAAGVTPAVSNASSGAVEWLPVAQVGNLVQAMDALREAGVWLVGLEDVPEAVTYDQADWRGPTALVVGSEGRGMRRLVREHCDFLARLPMAGHVGSLNAAVAGSIALYHAWRLREVEGTGNS